MRMPIDPMEDNAPAIIDPYRMERSQLALQSLQSVRWRHRKVLESERGVHGFQFAFGRSGEALEVANELITEQRLSPFVTERPDHCPLYRNPVRDKDTVKASIGISGREADVGDRLPLGAGTLHTASKHRTGLVRLSAGAQALMA